MTFDEAKASPADQQTDALDQIDKNEMAIYIMSGVFGFFILALLVLVIVLVVLVSKLRNQRGSSNDRSANTLDSQILAKGPPDDMPIPRFGNTYPGLPRATSPPTPGYANNAPPPPPQQQFQQPAYHPQPPQQYRSQNPQLRQF